MHILLFVVKFTRKAKCPEKQDDRAISFLAAIIDINTRKQISKLSVALIKSITYTSLVETLSAFVFLMCRCESIIPYLLAVQNSYILCASFPCLSICTILRFKLSVGS